jgi:hypothetical protein
VQAEIRRLAVRMGTDNPSWGYTRIQGALKNLGHGVARSTIAKILKKRGIPPSGERPMTWRTFLRAHWRALCRGFLHNGSLDRAYYKIGTGVVRDQRSFSLFFELLERTVL